jgi:allophanate hydrolase subunit 2
LKTVRKKNLPSSRSKEITSAVAFGGRSVVRQLKPGDQVHSKPISIEEAHHLLKEQDGRLKVFKNLIASR